MKNELNDDDDNDDDDYKTNKDDGDGKNVTKQKTHFQL
jgi:hypothetical protein